MHNVFFFFPEIWNEFWFLAEFYAEFFHEVQCVFRQVLLLHRTLFHCEWVVVVIIMQMGRIFQVNLQEIPNFVMRLAEVQVKNFIFVIQKLPFIILFQEAESSIWEILRLGVAI